MKKLFKTKKSRVLTIVLTVVLIFAIVIVSGIVKTAKAVSELSSVISTVTVEKRDLSDSISLSGTVKGATVNNVTSEASAKFTAVNVSVGDTVTEGDLLAVMDPTDIETSIKDTQKTLSNTNALDNLSDEKNQETLKKAQDAYAKELKEAGENLSAIAEGIAIWETKIADAKTAMDAAKTALDANPSDATLQANYAAAKEEYEYGVSYKSGLETKYETAKKSYDELKNNPDDAIESAEYTIETSKYTDNTSSAKETLKNLQEQLDGCNVYAPISGVVTAVNVAVGDTNTPGRAIITIQDTTTMVLETSVEESQILKLEEGMAATVTSTATGDEKINGTITRVVRVKSAGGTDGSSGTYAAEITMDSSELLVGMTAKAKIVLNQRQDVLAVPYDLIQEDEDGSKYVMAAVDNGDGTATAVKKSVEVGDEINYYTIITGGDLQEGDQIFFDATVTEGQTIFVTNEVTSTMEE